MNAHQISEIKITPDVVDCIVFWTKNPLPMMKRLNEIKDYNCYFQFTLTGYGNDVEVNLPNKKTEMIPVFQELSEKIGKQKVIWRYDPIFFSDRYTKEYHLKAFKSIAEALSGYTEKCVISFVDIYPKNKKNMDGLSSYELNDDELREFAEKLSKIATDNNIKIGSCAEKIDLDECGIIHNCCIDREFLHFRAQNDCECCSTDAINAKLGNLVENTNDINNFETAQKKIHDRMNKLSPDRATGSMKKRTNMITLLTEELRGYDAAEASYKKITEKLTEKQEQRKELAGIRDQYAKALQVASEESRREGIKQAYAAILQEEQEKKEALDAFADVFPGQVPQDEEFAKQNQDVQMLGVLKTTLFNLGLTEEEENRLQELGDKFENQIPSEEKITEMEKEQERFAKLKEEKTQLETKMSYFEAMAMKREEPDYTVKNRLSMMICGIILLVIGAAGGVLSFLLPQVQKMFLPLLAVYQVV